MIAASARACFAIGAGVVLAALQPLVGSAQEMLSPRAREVATMVGTWEASSDKHSRKCRIRLNGAGDGQDRLVVGMPIACRMALPGLVGVAQWALTRDKKIKLLASDGREVASFENTSNGGFKAELGGENLTLAPIGARYEARERKREVQTVVTPAPPPDDSRVTALSGRYSIAREAGGPPICSLNLSLNLTNKPDTRIAGLEPSCDDRGLLIFDPAGWRYENERLFLVARKGHSIGFQPEGNGVWRKEPAQGRPLHLKKE